MRKRLHIDDAGSPEPRRALHKHVERDRDFAAGSDFADVAEAAAFFHLTDDAEVAEKRTRSELN
jgi:hypothetical protein